MNSHLNIFLEYYIEAADKLGITHEIIEHPHTARFKSKHKTWIISSASTPLNSAPSKYISQRKDLTNKILTSENIPTITQELIGSKSEAIDFFNKYNQIVIKPVRNIAGVGITILPENEQEVVEAYNLAYEKDISKGSRRVLAEQYFNGQNYRLLVLGDKVIAGAYRVPASVLGNGKSTIAQLIEAKNIERKKVRKSKIVINDQLIKRLTQRDQTLDSIPGENENVILHFKSNMTSGGSTENVTDLVHPYYTKLAIDAARALDLKLAGVDIMTPDISKEGECIINEVNYNPGLRIHILPEKGEPIDVATIIMRYIEEKL